ncbi:MAG TPA: MarR family transcriptional regulator [Phycisphaerales bacterium]|nr:MarR family transcriptional regulator [Phycisphaerales bacterium]
MGSTANKAGGVNGLAREIHKRGPFQSAAQEAYLNVLRTASVLSAEFERLFRRHGLSGATYNALRILRGAGEEGRRCTEIGEHLVAEVPDVTRLIDRLERAELVKRSRGTGEDRRVVNVRITGAGLALLKKLDQAVMDLHQRQMGHMSRRDLQTVSELLCAAREGVRKEH